MENYHVPIKEKSLKFGEVLTPKLLVDEFLNKSCDYIDYSNPNLKILDTGAGLGAFSLGMLNILLKYHSKEHILNNMLYLIEIQEDSYNYLKDNYVNVICNDYLKYDYDFKFDIVMGNPPFNANGVKKLYEKFMLKSLNILNDNGYLLYIIPPSWRKPPTNQDDIIFDIIAHQNNPLFAKSFNYQQGVKIFNAKIYFDYLCVKKAKGNLTEFIDNLGLTTFLNLNEVSFIPHQGLEYFLKIKRNIAEEGFEIIHDSIYSPKKYIEIDKSEIDNYKYPIIIATNSEKKGGVRYGYVKENLGHFGIPKVIFSESGKGYKNAINDFEGKYGLNSHGISIIINSFEEGELIVKAFKTNFMNTILQGCIYTSFSVNWRVFTYFKKDFYNIILSY